VNAFEEVCAQVLDRIEPTPAERGQTLHLAESLRRRVTAAVEETQLKARVEVGGSVAKDTWLRGEADIDIFILFPQGLSKRQLGEYGLRIAKQAMDDCPTRERYAEHPYLEAFIDELRVNIVPCFNTQPGQWRSAADRSPHHTRYVNGRLGDGELRRGIRLLKRFAKGVEVYGAEIRVGGFSGYLCELLVMHSQSFRQAIDDVSRWQFGHVIDVAHYYQGHREEIPRLFDQPLVVIDPVDAYRNVAAAVTADSFSRLASAAKLFARNPSIRFFYPEDREPIPPPAMEQRLRSLDYDVVFVAFESTETVPDVLWGQLYKSAKLLRRLLSRNGFTVLTSAVWSDEARTSLFAYALETRRLPRVRRHVGPPFDSRGASDFLEKHTTSASAVIGPWLDGKRWYVGIRRQHTDAITLLQAVLEGRGQGAGKNWGETRKNVRVWGNAECLPLYRSDRGFAQFLCDFLDGKPKWLR
jgi:tRNA nucleotidyltransferase (CCA-adding enzyme)